MFLYIMEFEEYKVKTEKKTVMPIKNLVQANKNCLHRVCLKEKTG